MGEAVDKEIFVIFVLFPDLTFLKLFESVVSEEAAESSSGVTLKETYG